ncbi:MAG: Crp/Fnr family transcriptional regulator [Cyanobacteria bacterium J06635_15]
MNFVQPETLPPELSGLVMSRSLMIDQTLFHQGGAAADGFLLKTGKLKLVRYIDEDNSLTLTVVKPGDWVAPWILFQTQYSCSAIAEAASQVLVFPKFSLLPALKTHSKLAEAVMQQLATKLETLSFQQGLRDVRAAHERLRYYLIDLATPDPTGISTVKLNCPYKEVAADLGLTPETLSRALARLEETGKITRSRNVITFSPHRTAG